MWNWFQGQTVHFWQPITDPAQKWYRDSHIMAHAVGGVVWDVLFHVFALTTWHGQLVLAGAGGPWIRLAGVALVQFTLWELIQHENWRPELMTPPRPANSGYPWLSAIWDTLFTVMGASACELMLLAVRAWLGVSL